MNNQSTNSFPGVRTEVGDKVFYFDHVSPRKLQALLIDVAKVAGEPIADALGSADTAKALLEEGKDAAASSVNIGSFVTKISKNLSLDTLDKLMLALFQQTSLEGFGIIRSVKHLDEAFETLTEMYKAIVAAVEVYFGDFFGEGLGLAGLTQTN